MSTMSTVFPMQSDRITGHTTGGYPIGDRAVSSQDLADIDKEIYSDGIISTASGSGGYYQVTASNGMNVVVSAGKCYIRGRKAATPSNTTLTIASADALVDRTDRVVLRLDLSNEVRDVVITVKRGTTALTRTSSIWELGLADVFVAKGGTSIPQSAITDLRFNAAICGRAYNELLSVDTTSIFNQMNAMMTEQTGKWQTQTTAQQANWQTQTNNQQAQWETQRDKWVRWFAEINVEIQAFLSFDFDNLAVLPFTTRSTTFTSASEINERIATTSGNVTVATRRTVFNANGSITVTLELFDPTGVSLLNRSVITTTFDANGNVTEVVTQ